MKEPKIAVFAGHSLHEAGDEGSKNQVEEHKLVYPVALSIIGQLQAAGVGVTPHFTEFQWAALYMQTNNEALQRKIELVNEFKPAAAVEIHLNRGGGDYGLFIHYPYGPRGANPEGMLLADIMSVIARDAYKPPIKTWDTKALDRKLAFIHQTKVPAVITELAFMDGKDADYVRTPAFAQQYANIVTLGILAWLRETEKL